jgi:hypothetical protein
MRWLLDKPAAVCCAVLMLLQRTLASPVKPDRVVAHVPRQTITPGGPPCGQHNATNRRCWKNAWSIDTDYEHDTPPAFNTRTVCYNGPMTSDRAR